MEFTKGLSISFFFARLLHIGRRLVVFQMCHSAGRYRDLLISIQASFITHSTTSSFSKHNLELPIIFICNANA